MSGPRPPRSSYHQKALQQIRNSLQPFEAGGSTPPPLPDPHLGRGYSSSSSSPCPPHSISSPNRQSPVHQPTPRRGIEYCAQQYPFVPSQVPASVQQLLRRIDTVSPSSPSSSSSNSPTSQLQQLQQQQQQQQQQPIVKKPTLVIKSTAVQKPVLQTAVPYSSTININNLPPPPPYPSPGAAPPLPPKPSKKQVPVHPPPSIINGDYEERKPRSTPNANDYHNHRLPSNHHPPTMTNSNMNHTNGVHEYHQPQPPRLDLPPRIQRNGYKEMVPTDHQHSNGIGRSSPATSDTQSETSSITTNASNTTKNGLQPPTPPITTTEPPLPMPETNNNNNNSKLETNPPPPAPLTNGNGEVIHTHESPIPERKILSREKEEERFESKVRVYSPQAFKFFMEQHVENVIKSHQERLNRRKQLESEMRKIGLSEEAQAQMRRMLSQKESNYIRLKRAKMDKSLFKTIRTIGVGAFGEVALVRKLDTQHLYAMKTLRKSDVLRRNQVAHVKAERDILAEADNEWVVKLYYSFQDMDHLYFVMDYIPGGDLMSLLIKKGIFEEPLAQFYIAELTCAVESVHRMGFIHRDIKPDNILIDRDGHIKLTDFGLCTGFRWTHNSKYYQDSPAGPSICNCDSSKWQACVCEEKDKPLDRRRRTNVQRCLAHSLVGTPNYIAPEVLLRTGYTQLCDWWSVGVILYEMLVGQPPFLAPTPAETQYKVINWNTTLRIPPQANLSNNAKDLILKLCTDHSRRLGKGGAGLVKSHPFFTSIDFDAGLRRTTAPFIPQIRHPTDTSNFDPVDGDCEKGDDSDNPFESNQYHGFFEFTFRRFFDDAYYNNEDGGPVYV